MTSCGPNSRARDNAPLSTNMNTHTYYDNKTSDYVALKHASEGNWQKTK